jgi:hypothetical protein
MKKREWVGSANSRFFSVTADPLKKSETSGPKGGMKGLASRKDMKSQGFWVGAFERFLVPSDTVRESRTAGAGTDSP